jgi:hypothetical protein
MIYCQLSTRIFTAVKVKKKGKVIPIIGLGGL